MAETMTKKSPAATSAATSYNRSTADLEQLPDLATYVKTYAKQNPDVAAMWCFGVGFVLGWKLKPW